VGRQHPESLSRREIQWLSTRLETDVFIECVDLERDSGWLVATFLRPKAILSPRKEVLSRDELTGEIEVDDESLEGRAS
jgi:hypothetical protein